jgi:hypothetical protein
VVYGKENYQRHGLRNFQAVPLATSTIPRHTTIDTKILCQHILNIPTPGLINDETKCKHWSKLFNIQNRLFRGGQNARLRFSGMIRTDGISLCIIVKDSTTRCKRGRKSKEAANNETYLDEATASSAKGAYAVIDPNKRDLIFCLGSNGKNFRYTSSQRRKETKGAKYRKIRETLRQDAGICVEDNEISKRMCDPDEYTAYLEIFFTKRFSKEEELHSKELFRKLRFNTYINTLRSEARLINNFATVYGKNCNVIFGDWDSSRKIFKGQVATKGKGFRALFKRNGFNVLLLDEYNTSKLCPGCHEKIEPFKMRKNPKPWKDNMMRVHGLLRCQSVKCQQSVGYASRLWNRDVAATLNMKMIVESLLQGTEWPVRFKRNRTKSNDSSSVVIAAHST